MIYRDISKIAPQLASFGSFITEYASNGNARFKFDEENIFSHTLRIELHSYGNADLENGIISDCGVIIGKKTGAFFIPDGYDISAYSKLHFWVKGEQGNEQFGIALKKPFRR